MIRKTHNLVLKDTSAAEMARFRQFMLGIWRQQVDDEKVSAEMERYVNSSQTNNSGTEIVSIAEVISILNKFEGQVYKRMFFKDFTKYKDTVMVNCIPANNEVFTYSDSQGNTKNGTIHLKWNSFSSLDLIKQNWDVAFDVELLHTRFSLKIFDAKAEKDIAFEFVAYDYDLFTHLMKSLGIQFTDYFIEKETTEYLDKINKAKNDPNKLDTLYENFPSFLHGKISDDVLYRHLNLLLESYNLTDYFDWFWGGTFEDKAILQILYAIQDRFKLYATLNSDTALLYKIYKKLDASEIDDLLVFLTRLVEEYDHTPITSTVYFDNSYYLFRDTHLETNWSGKAITINNYKKETEKKGKPRRATSKQEMDREDRTGNPTGVYDVTLPKYYVASQPFNPLDKLNFGTKLGDDGEQLGDDNTFVIALKLHNMASRQSNWDLFNVATDLLSLLSAAGALRIVLTKGAPLATRILAGVVLAKDATHYTMLSNDTLQKWHDNGYGWLANLWIAFSVTTDLASFGLSNVSKIAREGNAAAELAETAEEAKEIRKIADKSNDYVKVRTGKEVKIMSEKQFEKFSKQIKKEEEILEEVNNLEKNKPRKGRLQANDSYSKNGYEYTTDSKGRINTAKGKIRLEKGIRSQYSQRSIGKGDGRLPNDQGGHLIGDQFGGFGGKENLVPMDKGINNYHKGEWGQMEKNWAESINKNPKIDINVNIEIKYLDETIRPSHFEIKESIDGKIRNFTIFNE